MKKVYRQKYVTTGGYIAEMLREIAAMIENGCIRVGPMELDLEDKQTWSVKICTDEQKTTVTMKMSWIQGILAPEIDGQENEILTTEDDSELT